MDFKPDAFERSPAENYNKNINKNKEKEPKIDFSLKGGPLHTDLLVAEAFIASGKKF